MAIIEAQLQFATLQDLGASVGTGDEISTNVYDTGPLATGSAVDMGTGQNLVWWIHVTENFAGASATIEALLVSDALVGGHDSNSTQHITSGDLVVGDWSTTGGPDSNGLYYFTLNPGQAWLQFVAIRWIITTTELTAGIYSSGLASDIATLQTLGTGMNLV